MNLGDEIIEYFYSKEFICTIITYLLGRESPCYKLYVDTKSGHWDVARPNIINGAILLDIICTLFKKSSLYNKRLENIERTTVIIKFYIII
jgi:hypothetical protein